MAQRSSTTILQSSISRKRLRVPFAIRPTQAVSFSQGFDSAIRVPWAARRTPPASSGAGLSSSLAPGLIISTTLGTPFAHSSSHRLDISHYCPVRGAFSCNPRLAPRKAFFSTSSRAMVATKIDGTAIAKKIRERLHAEIAEKQAINPRYNPSLKIIQGASPLQELFQGHVKQRKLTRCLI